MENRLKWFFEVFFVTLIFIEIFLLFISAIFELRITSYYNIGLFDLFASILLLLGYYFRFRYKLIQFKFSYIMAFIPVYFIFINLMGLSDSNILLISRLIVLLKVYVLLKLLNVLGSRVIDFQEKSKLIYPITFFTVMLFICSAVFLFAEKGINPNVLNYEDSIWYIIQTITTVGYGDIIPYTGIGRVTGVVAMLSAIIVTSLITASATSSLVEAFRKERDKLTEKSMKRIGIIEDKIDNINNKIDELDKIDDLSIQLKEIKNELENMKKSQ
ncbi:MAG: potassium channel family protein [Methanobacteriaceae archaeon]|nr:potassium channel family protein [Methanobacteriaceae archaeon]